MTNDPTLKHFHLAKFCNLNFGFHLNLDPLPINSENSRIKDEGAG